MGGMRSGGVPGPGDQSRLYGHGSDQHGWPSPLPRPGRRSAIPEAGPWSRQPPGFTLDTPGGPVHPLCAHASPVRPGPARSGPVRPGSAVWADDCADLAACSRPFLGFPPGCDEYSCARHAGLPADASEQQAASPTESP
jgi:hypothetical protein